MVFRFFKKKQATKSQEESTKNTSTVINTEQTLKDKPSKKILKRASRVRMLPLHEISFQMKSSSQKVQLSNLSVTGVGFQKDSFKSVPQKGSTLEGEFHFQDSSFGVEMTVVHTAKNLVGCQFTGDLVHIQDFVRQCFDLEIAATKLVRVNSKILKSEKDGQPHWFRGADNSELFFVEKDDAIIRFHLAMEDKYLEGGVERPLKCGDVIEDEDSEKPSYDGSSLVNYHATISNDLVEKVIRFLRNIDKLDETYVQQIEMFISNR